MKGLEMKSQTTSSMASEFSRLNLSEMESYEIPQLSIRHKIPLSQEREDRKQTTVPTPILSDAGKTAKRFAELIKKAPNHTVDLIEASATLGVQKEDLYTIADVLKATSVVVEEKQNKIRWVYDSPASEDKKRVRVHDSSALDDKKRTRVNDVTTLNGKLRLSIPKDSLFVEVVKQAEKLIRSPSYGKKKKWNWLFLTEADINDLVVYQSDVFMMLTCPCEINFKTPRPAKDGDGKQRRYGIMKSFDGIMKSFDFEGMNIYFVSKLDSYDVVNLDDTSRSLRLRILKKKRFEEVVRSLSNEKNGKKQKWNWLFLTKADINDFVVYQSDVYMIVNCPLDINLETPRPTKDGDDKQRRFGIVERCSEFKGKITYYVSKLESHDVVVDLGETSRSSHDVVVDLGETSRSSHDVVVDLCGTSRSLPKKASED